MRAALVAGVLALAALGARAEPARLTVMAAGSLRAPLTELAREFEAAEHGAPVALVFGASGLLRDRLQGGEAADVFASANMEHPRALEQGGRAGPVRRFARNAMCALARAGMAIGTDTLVARLLDPATRVGTSTPKADPSGDYAFMLFDRVESQGLGPAGSAQALKARALQLTGGPNSPAPPAGRSVYAMLVDSGQADVFITYCTNAVAARREVPALQVVPVPAAIDVVSDYGVTVLHGASPAAQSFVDFVLGPAGQAVLARHGFAARD